MEISPTIFWEQLNQKVTTIADIVETTAVAEKSVNNEEAINGKDDQLQDKRTSDEPTTAPVREERPEELAAEAKEESKITDRAEPCEIHREIAQTQSIKQPDQVALICRLPSTDQDHRGQRGYQCREATGREGVRGEKSRHSQQYRAAGWCREAGEAGPSDLERPGVRERGSRSILCMQRILRTFVHVQLQSVPRMVSGLLQKQHSIRSTF